MGQQLRDDASGDWRRGVFCSTAAFRGDPIPDAAPEFRLGNIELVAQDVAPEAWPVSIAVWRMGDSRTEDLPVVEHQLERDMMAPFAPRIPCI